VCLRGGGKARSRSPVMHISGRRASKGAARPPRPTIRTVGRIRPGPPTCPPDGGEKEVCLRGGGKARSRSPVMHTSVRRASQGAARPPRPTIRTVGRIRPRSAHLSAGWRGERGVLVRWRKSAFSFACHAHLRPRGQSRRGEAATPYHSHGRADPASVRPLVRRMAGRKRCACAVEEKRFPIR
jgi:hypothetical protein